MIGVLTKLGVGLFQGVVKDFLLGIILGLVKDAFQALMLQINWKVLVERSMTRVIVVFLRYLSGLSTNTLLVGWTDDMLEQMKSKGLKEAVDKNRPK